MDMDGSKSDDYFPEADEVIDVEASDSEKVFLPSNTGGAAEDNEVASVVDDEDDYANSYGVSAYGMSAVEGVQGPSKRGLPKIREVMRRQKQDSEEEDTPDVEYVYEDEDNFGAEIALALTSSDSMQGAPRSESRTEGGSAFLGGKGGYGLRWP